MARSSILMVAGSRISSTRCFDQCTEIVAEHLQQSQGIECNTRDSAWGMTRRHSPKEPIQACLEQPDIVRVTLRVIVPHLSPTRAAPSDASSSWSRLWLHDPAYVRTTPPEEISNTTPSVLTIRSVRFLFVTEVIDKLLKPETESLKTRRFQNEALHCCEV
jgi:hypothetical protein